MSKSLPPTPRRLREARSKGDSPRSKLLTVFATLAASTALGTSFVAALVDWFHASLESALSAGDWVVYGTHGASRLWLDTLSLLGPLLGAVLGVVLLVSLVQNGGVFVTRRQSSRSRVFHISGEHLYSTLRALVAAALVLAALALFLRGRVPLLLVAFEDSRQALGLAGKLLLDLGYVVAAVALVLGGFDFLAARNFWISRHKMSHSEVVQEAKDTRGDPRWRSLRRLVGRSDEPR